MNREFLLRDQIWFTAKDQFEAMTLFSLVEYNKDKKSIRIDESFEKKYMNGKYGAIPYINDLN